MIKRAYKTELAPTRAQIAALEKHVAAARVAHNWVLEQWLVHDGVRGLALGVRALAGLDAKAGTSVAMFGYAISALTRGASVKVRTPKDEPQRYRYLPAFGVQIPDFSPSTIDWYSRLAFLRKEQPERFGWLDDVSAFAVREAVLDVADGWKHFFEHLKAGRYERAGRPKFRPRRAERFHADQPNPIRVTERTITIPGVGEVRLKERGYLPATETNSHRFVMGGKVFGVGLSRVDGRWYVSLRCEVPPQKPGPRGPGRDIRPRPTPRIPGKRLGVENGVRVLAAAYDGESSEAFVDTGLRDDGRIQKLEMLRKRWERRMARRWKGPPNAGAKAQSRGWHEAKRKVAHYHARIVQLRDDCVGKTVRKLIDRGAETVFLREPHVAKLLNRDTAPDARARNALAPSVHGARMGDLRRRLEYKQVWAGGKIVLVDAFEPVTKRCSECGVVRETSPGYPNFKCASCGHVEDRDDVNAPKNLQNYSGGSSSGEANPRSADLKTSSFEERDNGRRNRIARISEEQSSEVTALDRPGNRDLPGAPVLDGSIDLSSRSISKIERFGAAQTNAEQFCSDTAIREPMISNLSQTDLQVLDSSVGTVGPVGERS